MGWAHVDPLLQFGIYPAARNLATWEDAMRPIFAHATDSDTNAERDYIIAELRNNRVIEDVNSYRSGQRLPLEPVNHYITDGEVTVARLAPT
jgi:hypothetical protein